jgi:hypothetical protein
VTSRRETRLSRPSSARMIAGPTFVVMTASPAPSARPCQIRVVMAGNSSGALARVCAGQDARLPAPDAVTRIRETMGARGLRRRLRRMVGRAPARQDAGKVVREVPR